LVIIVTPYLVKPSSAPLPLPTDGYKAASDVERVLLGKSFSGDSGGHRPVPTLAPPQVQSAPGTPQAQLAPATPAKADGKKAVASAAPAPGFSIK
jgi:pilus assembly protein CpaC